MVFQESFFYVYLRSIPFSNLRLAMFLFYRFIFSLDFDIVSTEALETLNTAVLNFSRKSVFFSSVSLRSYSFPTVSWLCYSSGERLKYEPAQI